jgi:hypothetical protein
MDQLRIARSILGSDLHIYGEIISSMKSGETLGHENMGEAGFWARLSAGAGVGMLRSSTPTT